jgi:adenosylcobinamide-phosphate guanylyltransferase
MKVTAIIMAGGRGKRLALSMEKPLLEVGGKPVVEHVLKAVKNASQVESVVVTISEFTPRTEAYLKEQNVKVLKTPGEEYVADLAYAIKALKPDRVLAIGADLPLITSEIIDNVITHFDACGKPSLAVAVPVVTRQQLGMGPGYVLEHCGESVVYAGINMIEGKKIDEGELEQEIYVVDGPEAAININTAEELQIAREQFLRLQR